MTDKLSESEALVATLGELCVDYFGKENLQKLFVEYTPALEQAVIYVALWEQSNEAMEKIFQKYIDEIVPLYIGETMLDLRFFVADSPVFAASNHSSKSKTYAMA